MVVMVLVVVVVVVVVMVEILRWRVGWGARLRGSED